jgi:hypothetical protein
MNIEHSLLQPVGVASAHALDGITAHIQQGACRHAVQLALKIGLQDRLKGGLLRFQAFFFG